MCDAQLPLGMTHEACQVAVAGGNSRTLVSVLEAEAHASGDLRVPTCGTRQAESSVRVVRYPTLQRPLPNCALQEGHPVLSWAARCRAVPHVACANGPALPIPIPDSLRRSMESEHHAHSSIWAVASGQSRARDRLSNAFLAPGTLHLQ